MISYFDFRAWVLLAMCSLLGPLGMPQQPSREEAIAEAGRLETEALTCEKAPNCVFLFGFRRRLVRELLVPFPRFGDLGEHVLLLVL